MSASQCGEYLHEKKMKKKIKIFIVILPNASIVVITDAAIGFAPAYECYVKKWLMPEPANGHS